jgi:hypothetical protein
MVQVPLSSPPATPNVTLWTEAGLRAFRGTSLSGQQQLSSLLLVDGFVQQHIRLSLQLGLLPAAAPRDTSAEREDYPSNIMSLADPAQIPLLLKAGREALVDDGDDFFGTELDFGLRTILDGIEQLVGREDRQEP